jgi:hypothetical protein
MSTVHCELRSSQSITLKEVCDDLDFGCYRRGRFAPTLIVIDMVSVKLRCTLKGEMKEFVFSAKKPTLEGLGFANMEEG